MHSSYQDIHSRIAEEPMWYDQNGTPRYGPFRPDLCPNIYARRIVLLKIACQVCKRLFLVEMHQDMWHDDHLPPRNWHYGDPPLHGCVGDTMNCDDIQVLEVWEKQNFKWVRARKWEGPVDPKAD